jgi:hypothetical protein
MTLADALRIAREDAVFAKQLLQDPDSFKTAFNLTPEQVNGLRNANLGTVLNAVPDPQPGQPGIGGFY